MEKAMARGRATSPTVTPASRSRRNLWLVYPRKQSTDFGNQRSSKKARSISSLLQQLCQLPITMSDRRAIDCPCTSRTNLKKSQQDFLAGLVPVCLASRLGRSHGSNRDFRHLFVPIARNLIEVDS